MKKSAGKESTRLNTNAIAFIALCNEYCVALENVEDCDRDEFVSTMLHLLPRLYISATDLKTELVGDNDFYIEGVLDEDYYDAVRRGIENKMGPDDMYLEVFEEDMKYSDTPIAASISEGLVDLFQALYNFIEAVKDASQDVVKVVLAVEKDDFKSYWSRILCNVLRALNSVGNSVEYGS